MATSKVRDTAFVLHSTPYSETSLIVDLLTREHGRVGVVAKGAKRAGSALRAVLLQFQLISVVWSGHGELRTLNSAEWLGGMQPPHGDALLCAFYTTELPLRMLPREDAPPALFDTYSATLTALSEGAPLEETLRGFEWQLLRETGHAPELETDAAGEPIHPNLRYAWQPGSGVIAAEPGSETAVGGKTLLDLAAGRLTSSDSRSEAKYLARAILSHQLEGYPLRTRQVLIDLHKLSP
ncbi:MAG: DNA repair protein RecO [Betaproteobacteria bacterium]